MSRPQWVDVDRIVHWWSEAREVLPSLRMDAPLQAKTSRVRKSSGEQCNDLHAKPTLCGACGCAMLAYVILRRLVDDGA